MSWLIFPGICAYFLIGWMLADAFKSDLVESNIESILWFLFWPIPLFVFVVFFSVFLIVSFVAIMILLIDKVIRYFKPRRKRPNAS